MIRSMTGFGAASGESASLAAAVTVRGFNHRFLELTLHVSKGLFPLEPEIKGLVQSRVRRGKVEVAVRAAFREGSPERVEPSRTLVASLVEALRALKSQHRLEGDVSVSDVARFPGAIELAEGSPKIAPAAREQVLKLVGEALDVFEGMRRAEGENIAKDLEARLATLLAVAGRIESLAEEGKGARCREILEKARSLVAELGLEEGKVYQEVIRLVDRQDVSEETQRLRSHVSLARQILRGEGDSGKRLDFLCQEMMREASTIGGKSASAALVQEVVELKSAIEKLREQVQNVE